MNGQNELIGVLARRARVIAWAYDAQKDCLTYWLPQKDGSSQIKDIKNSDTVDEWRFLWEGQPTGGVDVHEPGKKDGAIFRLTYKRLDSIGAVVGFAEVLSMPKGDKAYRGGVICNEVELTARINADMLLLNAREKGVLFAIGIDEGDRGNLADESQKEKCVESMMATIRSEFRDKDIFGFLWDARFIVFFRGALSIDVLERRAQHFLDEFSRRALDSSITASCTIGIAVTGGGRSTAKELMAAAGQTLDDAMLRGANHYRMFESEKY